jgi:diaminopimelate epimerase
VTLATELGIVKQDERFSFRTSSGPIPGRFGRDGPQVGMPAVADANPSFDASLASGERSIGFARVGVPHLVVACSDVDRSMSKLATSSETSPSLVAGATANFVSRR